MSTLAAYIEELREATAEPAKGNRYLVVPNDAPAYAYMGAWGIYDTERGAWINFRDSEVDAYRLLATLLQCGDLPHIMPGVSIYTASIDCRMVTDRNTGQPCRWINQELAYGRVIRELRIMDPGTVAMVYADGKEWCRFQVKKHRGEVVTVASAVLKG